MADINSNKNSIIIQPITLQIRAPFQFLTNQRAIKHTHYSESSDGLNGRCSFSVVWTVSSSTKAVKLNRFHLFFKFRRASVLFYANLACPVTVQISTQYGSRLIAKEEKSTFQISSLLLSSFVSNIYAPEKGYYWQNPPNSLKVKRYQEVNSNVK